MGFMKFFKPSKHTQEKKRQPKTTNSAGWTFYSCLPYGEPWPQQKVQNWVMEKGTQTKAFDYQGISCQGTALVWHDRTTGETRVPKEQSLVVDYGAPFVAAGKSYKQVQDLVRARWRDDPSGCWALDCYGRKVFCVWERFPCFDSYDYLSEDRCYRWMYICQSSVLTRICTTDDYNDQKIFITEDAAFLENKAWEKMEQAGYLERR